MEFLYVAVITVFLVDSINAIDCQKNPCRDRGEQHVLCTYRDPEPAPGCGNVLSAQISMNEKKEIILTHNSLRSYVAQGYESRGNPGPQPPAENMNMLIWDYDLAQTAQRWANQCSMSSAPCVDEDRFEVGQAAGFVQVSENPSNLKPTEIIYKFYNQVIDMDRNNVTSYSPNSENEMYTQLVWAKTNKVGCGKIEYEKSGKVTYFLICLYGPKGNVEGESIYDILL